jgi:hypothetical protein
LLWGQLAAQAVRENTCQVSRREGFVCCYVLLLTKTLAAMIKIHPHLLPVNSFRLHRHGQSKEEEYQKRPKISFKKKKKKEDET